MLGSLYLLTDGGAGSLRGWWRKRTFVSPKALTSGNRNAHRGPLADQPVDLDMQSESFYADLKQKMRRDQRIGSEYCTFQVCLPPRYLNTGGEYRSDPAFLGLCVARMARIQALGNGLGLNVYFETHVDRISEDISAFAAMLDMADAQGIPLEVNGDLSHYVYRAITKGKALPKILGKVHHMHQRMARVHGDLSSAVEDPRADWEAGGATAAAWDMSAQALRLNGKGLSSRVICGEAGPMHLVSDTLTEDEKMVPLLRKLCEYADDVAAGRRVVTARPRNPFR